jgi:hypothetical protein
MKDKTACILFLGVCAIEAVLLLLGLISPLTGAGIFAAALVFFGGFSLAHRRKRRLTGNEGDS